MKLYHYVLIFAIVAISMIVVVDLKVSNRSYMSDNSELTNGIFDKAVDAATNELLADVDGLTELQKDNAVEVFFDSLYASFGIVDSPASRENMALYVPVICVTSKDGFYVYYDDVRYAADGLESVRCWSELKTYNYREKTAPSGYRATDFIIRFLGEDVCYVYDTQGITGTKGAMYEVFVSDFFEELEKYKTAVTGHTAAAYESEYLPLLQTVYGSMNYYSILAHPDEFAEKKRETVASAIEQNLNYYCNIHNTVAQQNGVLYSFSIPSFDADVYLRSAMNTSFLAFFQGYPVPGTDEVFNRYSVSNAQAASATVYYIDDTYTYHKDGCTHATEIIDVSYSQQGAAGKGAYACDYCYPNTGAHRH